MKTLAVSMNALGWVEVAGGTADVMIRRNGNARIRFHVGQTVPPLDTPHYTLMDHGDSDEIKFLDLAATDRVFARADQISSGIVSVAVMTSDTTAPVLAAPVGTKDGHDTGHATWETTEGGGPTYWVLSLAADAVTAQQIQDGQMHTNAAAAKAGIHQTTAQTTQRVDFTGLQPEVQYYFSAVQLDKWGNLSNVIQAAPFLTDAAPPPP